MQTVATPAELEADTVAANHMDELEAETSLAIRRALTRINKRLEPKARELRAQLNGAGEEDLTALSDRLDTILDEVEELRESVVQIIADATDGDYTHADVAGWLARSREMGCTQPKLGPVLVQDLIRRRRVPNARLRARAEQLIGDGASLREIARLTYENLSAMEREDDADYGAASFMRAEGAPDITRLERILGLAPYPGSRGGMPTLTLFVGYEQAVALSRALHMTPIDAGI